MKKLIVAAVAALAFPATVLAGVVINEVMQSNVYCIMDDINEFPDSWVELYNNGDADINIKNYRIGTKDKFKKAYKLPSAVIPAGGHLLVYCDKAEDGLHADFRVDSGKGDVFLFDPEGEIVDQLSLKKQPAPDVAYGRTEDGGDSWGYELTPTPGAANTGGVSDVVLGEVGFSEPGGVWKASKTLEITLTLPDNAPEGAKIIYTTDGSEPTMAKSKEYTAPVRVSTGTVVRAKAVGDGCISRPSNAQSYIFLGRDVTLPVISIAINDEYLYDKKLGIFADGTGGPNHENYRYDWRRPMNVEYFAGEGAEAAFNQIGETRVQGGYTRSNKLKSMAMYANKRFGEKRFNCELWPDDKPGVTDNKSFILRNGGNDFGWCYMRDAIMQRVIGRNTKAVDWQGAQPAIVCINGQYHGMLNIRERSSEDNIAANYDGLEDIDMFENWNELKAGDWEKRNELEEFIKTEHTFDEWKEVVDIESFAALMALNAWIYNTDFPHNNTVMWRRTDGVDGRWRWLVKDCDFGLGIWNSNDNISSSFYGFLNTNTWDEQTGYILYRQMVKCPEFRDYLINLNIVYQGDFLNRETFIEITDELKSECWDEMLRSHQKWGEWWSNLSGNYDHMEKWIKQRHLNMPSLMRKDWGLGNYTNVKVNKALDAAELQGITVRYNDIPLSRGTFSGKDYEGRTVTLSGDNVKGWSVKKGYDEARIVEGPQLTFTVEWVDYEINAIPGEAGIADVAADGAVDYKVIGGEVVAPAGAQVYDIAGRLVGEGCSVRLPGAGAYIIRAGGTVAKIQY